ncbi:uncharacterized protein LOC103179937 [Callorhinchus milii]|uniref:uncharacterized protein LOC103179937 n=1 Tax=Callorhinchus milii TaxID=7868 RepID=UPI0004573F74|nr:uncharacterized protein LOC103179937 [Callorhinchus milii]|eukprot:gi/632955842/ref/XP_007893663.1/ PREDICTED: uncharacterized protein LOC103179937 [Callorhinchus milii]
MPAAFLLASKESDKDHVSKCDCHMGDQSDFSRSSQTFESTNGNTSYNAGTGNTHRENEDCNKPGNTTNSGSHSGSKTIYTTSVLKSVLSVNGSVIFNVTVKVNHAAEPDRRGDKNFSATYSMEEDSTDSSEGKEGFPVEDENAQSECDLNTNLGFPVQEQHCKEPVNVPMQEGQASRERWKESPRFTSKTIKQVNSRECEENAIIPVQEEGKSEHLSNEEQSK